MIKGCVFLFLTILLVSCGPRPINPTPTRPAPAHASLPSTAGEAHDELINFLTLLHTKNYPEAALLYGGEDEQLQVFNTEIDPADQAALWMWACDHQLLQCLEVRSVTFKELRGDMYLFQVEFNNPDGSLFVRGPCCGASETEMPAVFRFEFRVSRNADGRFVVMDTPPYVP